MLDEVFIKSRIERVRGLAHADAETSEYYEAAAISQSIVYDTIGAGHPLMRSLEESVKSAEWTKVLGACKAVIALYDDDVLKSPVLRIAHEMEGEVLDIAEKQAKMAEAATDPVVKQLGLSIAAFLSGAALEDALRRLCDTSGVAYDAQFSKISKLQEALYQPSKNIEVITQSENKQITAWGDTRNKADHGKFAEITQTEVAIMTIGVRSFIDKHLP